LRLNVAALRLGTLEQGGGQVSGAAGALIDLFGLISLASLAGEAAR